MTEETASNRTHCQKTQRQVHAGKRHLMRGVMMVVIVAMSVIIAVAVVITMMIITHHVMFRATEGAEPQTEGGIRGHESGENA